MLNLDLTKLIERYKAEGVGSLKSELPFLTTEALKDDAKLGFRRLVVDVYLDLAAFDRALELLNLIERGTEPVTASDVHYNNVAYAKWNLNDIPGAIEAYKHSIKLNPSNL